MPPLIITKILRKQRSSTGTLAPISLSAITACFIKGDNTDFPGSLKCISSTEGRICWAQADSIYALGIFRILRLVIRFKLLVQQSQFN